MAKIGQTFKSYSYDFKVMAVEAYLSKKYGGLLKVCKMYQLPCASILARWVKEYQGSGIPYTRQSGRPKKESLNKTIKYHQLSIEEKLKYKEMECDVLKKLQALLVSTPSD